MSDPWRKLNEKQESDRCLVSIRECHGSVTHFGEVPGVSGGALGRKGAAGQEWKEGELRAGWQPARPAVAEGWDQGGWWR